MKNPYVFVVGTPRSGTTLLKRILDTHSQVAMLPETHWIPRCYRDNIGVTKEGIVKPEIVTRLLQERRVVSLGITADMLHEWLTQNPQMSYANLVSEIFNHYRRTHNKPIAGDKTPSYVRNIPLLHKLWPHAKFVHLIRDGRDVCLSMLNWKHSPRAIGRCPTWEEDPVSTTALWWKWHVGLGLRDGRSLNKNIYHEICYEQLVSESEKVCVALCDFLEVPFEPTMLEFYVGKLIKTPGLSAKKAWLPVTQGLRNWRNDLAPCEVERFEAIAGDLLTQLDYPRMTSVFSSQTLAHAEKMGNRFPPSSHARNRPIFD